ncbi:hypothetical protein LXL04_021789 [Taraxacum kok-saghyz]
MSNVNGSGDAGNFLDNDEILVQALILNINMVYNMDFSSNKLVDEIPVELTALSLLMGLNLSNNHLSGSIPNNIGNMLKLESLDLCGNKLTGVIPHSMSFEFVTQRLVGTNSNWTPTTNSDRPINIRREQRSMWTSIVQQLLASTRHNNNNNTTTTEKKHKGVDVLNNVWLFYMDVISGFATGFWGVIGVLLLKKQWRRNLFRFAEEMIDNIYVTFVVGD